MNRLSLTDIATELLQINEHFYSCVKDPYNHQIGDFDLVTFEQWWGNTSGAFEGIGGSAMTKQRTYVLLPISDNVDYALVFFGGRFGYRADLTDSFKEDVERRQMLSVKKGREEYKIKA